MKHLVIVESPTKARTIRKFLGKDYIVESCMGHIRDLPPSAKDIPAKYKKQKWASLGLDVEHDFAPIYCIPKDKTKIVTELKKNLKEADQLYLATDEDREGESISWHLLEVLDPKVPVKRMVFHEITDEAIHKALEETREVDMNLVKAQEARRFLDRLVGYTISPLLWKKVAYGLSAGRVQSVAVRLICERELERIRFKRAQYYDLAGYHKKEAIPFESRLISYDEKRIVTGKDFDALTGQLAGDKQDVLLLNEASAENIKKEIERETWKVTDVQEKPTTRRPPPPFITSTLQQEASRKLGFASKHAMRVAQSLYEQGFITYMRTDSTNLSGQALNAARNLIGENYGPEFLPPSPRFYGEKKVKGAQEAHEAIRPAGSSFQLPEKTGLSGDEFKLYDLIWKRTVACQMVDAQMKQVSVRLQVGKALFGASGTTIEFPGFLRAYVEGQDNPEQALEDQEVRLPPLAVNETVPCEKVEVVFHETKPPARYTEASLIQTMEKEGIGRPSTYATTISTIMDRGYVYKLGTALAPTFVAMVVTKLLKNHFPEYVDVSFTSEMEKSLDDIALGDLDWLKYLKSIYLGPRGLQQEVIDQEAKIDPDEARGIRLPNLEGIDFRVGRYGAYVCQKENGQEVCASVPESQPPADLSLELIQKLIDQKKNGADALGKDPVTGESIYVLTGRYGPYVQRGESNKEDLKPKQVSIPPSLKPEEVTMEKALALLSLPRTLGLDPKTGKEVKAGLGRFGPYVVLEKEFRSIPKTDSIFDITLERALELLAEPKKGRGGRAAAKPLKELGTHPDNKEAVTILEGKYGPYVKWGKINASLPKDKTVESFTLDEAVTLLKDKKAKPSKRRKR